MAQTSKHHPNTQRQQDIQRVVGTLQQWIVEGKLEKIQVYKEVGEIFQLSVRTIRKYASADPGTLRTPSKKRRGKKRIREQVDDFGRAAISRIINNMHSVGFSTKLWQDENFTSRYSCLSEGTRYVVVHAGTKDGFVRDAGLVFSASGREDYHGSVTAELFNTWMREELLPKLESPSIIVMDNASYHSAVVERLPTSNWTKDEIKEWLSKYGLSLPANAYKKELLEMARRLSVPKRYAIDELVQEQGHMVLRLPPYHCHYNPIEYVLSEAKRAYASKARTIEKFNKEAVVALWQKILDEISPERWSRYVNHCEKLIIQDWTHEEKWERGELTDIIIHIGDEDDQEPLAIPLND